MSIVASTIASRVRGSGFGIAAAKYSICHRGSCFPPSRDGGTVRGMRAAIFLETGQALSLEAVPPISPGPRDVIVHTDASGVCHSDQSLIERMPGGNPMAIAPRPWGAVEWVGGGV